MCCAVYFKCLSVCVFDPYIKERYAKEVRVGLCDCVCVYLGCLWGRKIRKRHGNGKAQEGKGKRWDKIVSIVIQCRNRQGEHSASRNGMEVG